MRARRRAALLLAATVTAVAAVSGCGVNEAGAAAVVDGRVISDQDVQTVAAEVNKGVEGLQEPFTAKTTLPWLILGPYVLREAEKAGKGVSASQARTALTKLDEPSATTVEFVRAYIAAQSSLDQQGGEAVLKDLAKAKISVNPRYGTFDSKAPTQLLEKTPAWVKVVSPAPAATTSLPPPDGSPTSGNP